MITELIGYECTAQTCEGLAAFVLIIGSMMVLGRVIERRLDD